MKLLLPLLACLLLAGCSTTPGYLAQGGVDRTPEVFIPGAQPKDVQAYVNSDPESYLQLIKEEPGLLLYSTKPGAAGPLTYGRYTFTAEAGGTRVRMQESYPRDGRILVVNSPRYLAVNQRNLDILKARMELRTPSPSTRNVANSGRVRSSLPSRVRCAATTRKGYRCSRWAEPGSAYCWQHQR